MATEIAHARSIRSLHLGATELSYRVAGRLSLIDDLVSQQVYASWSRSPANTTGNQHAIRTAFSFAASTGTTIETLRWNDGA